MKLIQKRKTNEKIIVTVLALFMVAFITACGNVSTTNVDLEQSEANEQTYDYIISNTIYTVNF